MTQAAATASHAVSTSRNRQRSLTSAGQASGEPGSGVGSYGPVLRQHNTQRVQHNTQRNVLQHHQHQSVHNTIDPQQLEQLVGSLVQSRVEAIASQMREQMSSHIKQMEFERQARLSQAVRDKDAQIQQ